MLFANVTDYSGYRFCRFSRDLYNHKIAYLRQGCSKFQRNRVYLMAGNRLMRKFPFVRGMFPRVRTVFLLFGNS
jgi:hypothetical protein